jgi:hypothetical protein
MLAAREEVKWYERKEAVKLPVNRAGLPGKTLSFILCPFIQPIPARREGARTGHRLLFY